VLFYRSWNAIPLQLKLKILDDFESNMAESQLYYKWDIAPRQVAKLIHQLEFSLYLQESCHYSKVLVLQYSRP